MVLIATNASGLRLPILGRGDAPLHLVPIDYVSTAAWQRRAQRTARPARRSTSSIRTRCRRARVFEGVAEHANTEMPRGTSRARSRAPCCARPASRGSAADRSRSSICSITAVHYDQTNTAQALAGTTVRCPALADYLPALVRYVLEVARERGAATSSTRSPTRSTSTRRRADCAVGAAGVRRLVDRQRVNR